MKTEKVYYSLAAAYGENSPYSVSQHIPLRSQEFLLQLAQEDPNPQKMTQWST